MSSATPATTYSQIIARSFRENRLMTVMLELTYRCNLDCYFCYNDLKQKGTPLRLEQYLDLLEDLHRMQVMNLVLTGGEPLSHPDFFAIGARARELEFVVRLKSNGHALGGRLLERLKNEVDPWLIEVSLHGATPATHDRQTRVPGSFERLVRNMAEIRATGIRLKINSTLTRWNQGEVSGMLQLAQEIGAPLAIDLVVTPRDDGDLEPLRIAATDEGIRRATIEQAEFYRRLAPARDGREDEPVPPEVEAPRAQPAADRPHCGAGIATLTVDPFGNVYPCVQWRRAIGNVHRDRVNELWRQTEIEEIRTANHDAHRTLAALGDKGKLAAFCPGLAVQQTGSPVTLYPSALRRIEVLSQTAEPRRALPVLD